MTHRQIRNRAQPGLTQKRVVLDNVVGAGKVPSMTDQRTLGISGGTRGVDDEGRIAGLYLLRTVLQPLAHNSSV